MIDNQGTKDSVEAKLTGSVSVDCDVSDDHYEEPPQVSAKDSAGVVIALIALTIIGFLGYTWLTPQAENAPKRQSSLKSNNIATTEGVDSESSQNLKAEHISCPYCGMYAEMSESHIVAHWEDGSITHHDCWDCMFYNAIDEGLQLDFAEVSALGTPVDNPDWIDAATAWYLYDMDKEVPGSMQPYVGAFSSEEEALTHQNEWGGEIVDFVGLSAMWH